VDTANDRHPATDAKDVDDGRTRLVFPATKSEPRTVLASAPNPVVREGGLRV